MADKRKEEVRKDPSGRELFAWEVDPASKGGRPTPEEEADVAPDVAPSTTKGDR